MNDLSESKLNGDRRWVSLVFFGMANIIHNTGVESIKIILSLLVCACSSCIITFLRTPLISSGGDSHQEHPVAMAGSRPVAAALVTIIGVVVVMAMVVCSPNALYRCLGAIQGARPPEPSRQCCTVVKKVDNNCMCSQLKASSFPAQTVSTEQWPAAAQEMLSHRSPWLQMRTLHIPLLKDATRGRGQCRHTFDGQKLKCSAAFGCPPVACPQSQSENVLLGVQPLSDLCVLLFFI